MTEAAFWFVNTVTVRPYLGQNSDGPVYDSARPVACWLEDETKVVTTRDGAELVSTARLFVSNADAALFTPSSEVTTPGGTSNVVTNNSFDSGGIMPEIDHAEITLA